MKSNKPVDLSQKIQYLHEKINNTYQQILKSGLFDHKIKFIQFIDEAIDKIYHLPHQKSSPVKQTPQPQKTYQSSFKSQFNQKQKSRIQREKALVEDRLKEIKEREKMIQIEALRIEIENGRIIKEKMSKGHEQKQKQLKQYVFQMQSKTKSIEKQLQRVIKLNAAQAKQIELVKQQRNKAEKSYLQWQQKYESQISMIEKFSTNKEKYSFRDYDGLRIHRIFTNVTNPKKGCSRLVLCDLPLKFQVLKIAYGIKIGIFLANKQIEYLNEFILYEKEEMLFSYAEDVLMLEYIKRKIVLKLQKYKVLNNQIIIMLFGKGDSISLDESK